MSEFINSTQSLINFINQRPKSEFKSLDLSQVNLLAENNDTEIAKTLMGVISEMELVSFKDAKDFSLFKKVNPTKVEKLSVDFNIVTAGNQNRL